MFHAVPLFFLCSLSWRDLLLLRKLWVSPRFLHRGAMHSASQHDCLLRGGRPEGVPNQRLHAAESCVLRKQHPLCAARQGGHSAPLRRLLLLHAADAALLLASPRHTGDSDLWTVSAVVESSVFSASGVHRTGLRVPRVSRSHCWEATRARYVCWCSRRIGSWVGSKAAGTLATSCCATRRSRPRSF